MTADLVSLLTQETAIAAKVVAGVNPSQLNEATPCPDFDVRALINHMCMGNHFLAQVLEGRAVMPDYDRDFVGEDQRSAYERSRDDLLRAAGAPGLLERTVPFPGMDVPAAAAVGIGVMEAIVHRWDVAKAIGSDPAIESSAADTALEVLRPMIPDAMRAPAPDQTTRTIPFAPQVEVPEGASGTDRLLAFTGRRP